jgi:hypothetical protein
MYGVPQNLVDDFFANADGGVTPDLRRRLEELAPPPPQSLRDENALRRWVASAFTAAAVALDQAADPAEQRAFVLHAARAIYSDASLTI